MGRPGDSDHRVAGKRASERAGATVCPPARPLASTKLVPTDSEPARSITGASAGRCLNWPSETINLAPTINAPACALASRPTNLRRPVCVWPSESAQRLLGPGCSKAQLEMIVGGAFRVDEFRGFAHSNYWRDRITSQAKPGA